MKAFESLREEFERYEERSKNPPPSRLVVPPILKKFGLSGQTPEDMVGIRDLMRSAGKVLFNSVQAGTVCLDPEPEWIREHPDIPCIVANEEEGYVDEGTLCFDTYWWCALVFLSRQHPEIVMPIGGMFYEQFQPCLTRDQFRQAMIREHGLGGMSDDERIHVEAVAARVSIAACRLLSEAAATSRSGDLPDGGQDVRVTTAIEKSSDSSPIELQGAAGSDPPVLAWKQGNERLVIGDTTGCRAEVRVGTVPWAILSALRMYAGETALPLRELVGHVDSALRAAATGRSPDDDPGAEGGFDDSDENDENEQVGEGEEDAEDDGLEKRSELEAQDRFDRSQLVSRLPRLKPTYGDLPLELAVVRLRDSIRMIRGRCMKRWRNRWIHWTPTTVYLGLQP
jgi:hypothetical protein